MGRPRLYATDYDRWVAARARRRDPVELARMMVKASPQHARAVWKALDAELRSVSKPAATKPARSTTKPAKTRVRHQRPKPPTMSEYIAKMEHGQKSDGIEFVVLYKKGDRVKGFKIQEQAEAFARTEKGTHVQSLASLLADLKAR
jgi:hypothetical protein